MAYERILRAAGTTRRTVVRRADDMPPSEPPVRRRRLGASDAREAILAAAEALLVASGPQALRVTEIAAKAGVTHPNVLYHFGSVAELERQLAQRVAVRLADRIVCVFATEGALPVERAVAAVFDVFDAGGFARLLAWLALSQNSPALDQLGSRLECVRASIAAHPAIHGEHNAQRRRRLLPAIELVIVAAIGYGLAGRTFDELFASEGRSLPVAVMLAGLLKRS